MATEKEKCLPFTMTHLPDSYKEKARRELNETPERRIKALEEMKKMARDNNVTCDIEFADDYLLQFLRQRKYDVSKSFKQLVDFTSLRKKYVSYFLSIEKDLLRDPRRQFCTILPYRCPDGCTIILTEIGKWNPDEISFHDFLQTGIMLLSQVLRDPMTQINGFKNVIDYTGVSLKHARYATPANLYMVYHSALYCFPCRYKEIHLVSDSPLMKAGWAIVKTFMSRKLKQRVIVSSNRTDLLNHFPPEVLPTQYGGLLEDYRTMEFTERANRHQEGFTLRGQDNYY